MKRPSRSTVAWIVLGNLGTLWGVWFGGLTPGYVAGTYLVEIAVVGLMLSLVPLIPWVPWKNEDGKVGRLKGAIYLFLFACVYGGGAAIVMGGLVGGQLFASVIDNFRSYWYAAAALVLSNAIVLFRWSRAQRGGEGHLDGPVGHFLRLTIAATMFIFPAMVLGIFSAPTFSSVAMGSIVVLTKTGGDVFMSYRLSAPS